MNFFKRLFKIGEAEANAAIDHMEDPIHMTEQGIRDMKQDLSKSLEALAQVKALVIRSKAEIEEAVTQAEDYQQKAMLILKKSQRGDLESNQADELAKKALIKKEEALQEVQQRKKEAQKYEYSSSELEKNIQETKKTISKWESELKILKSRIKVAKATKNLNKQMAAIDSSSTVSMLERMKDKINQEEALAEAYGDLSGVSTNIDKEIDEVANSSEANAETDLAKLKEELGINDN